MRSDALSRAVAGALPSIPPVTVEAPDQAAPQPRVGKRTRALSQPEMLEAFLTQDEAAGLLRVHPRTLRRWARGREAFPLPVVFGTRVLYRRNEVYGYIRRKMDERTAGAK
jgi:hypothetical protein